MSQFHTQSWVGRFAELGDTAEAIFEQVYPNNWVRFGLNRPPLKMSSLTVRSRYAPDYLTSDGYVEVKGCGRDGIIKIKRENLDALQWWHSNEQVRFFFWDSHRTRHVMVGLRELTDLIDNPDAGITLGHFHDPKAFFGVPVNSLDGWVDHASA